VNVRKNRVLFVLVGAASAGLSASVLGLGCSSTAGGTGTTSGGGHPTTTTTGTTTTTTTTTAVGLEKVNHFVIIYLENHSFDNLFGDWPGAENISKASAASKAQIDANGNPYTTLPVYGPSSFTPDAKVLPANTIANGPFDITMYAQETDIIDDVLHRFYQEQYQINAGKMDSFVLWNNNSGGQAMGYYPTMTLPVSKWMTANAKYVTLCDHFFHAAFGGSFLNHHWLIAAQTPTFANAPANVTATLVNGKLAPMADTNSMPSGAVYTTPGDGFVTPDGFAVNTSYSVNWPHPASTAVAKLVPQQTNKTIGDLLDTASVGWAWYAGGWNATLHAEGLDAIMTSTPSVVPDGGPDGLYSFQYHHQPFVYYTNWGGTATGSDAGPAIPNGKWVAAKNLQDEQDFLAQAAAGTLRPVSFVKPLYDEHANYTTETDSQNHTLSLVNAVMNGPSWKDTVIIITYDEHGGWWDHVAPPTSATATNAAQADKWGPGSRVPGIIISPFAKGGVDTTSYDTTAILKLIEKRWSLPALSTRDAAQNDLSANALSL
jgi:phospholipase C